MDAVMRGEAHTLAHPENGDGRPPVEAEDEEQVYDRVQTRDQDVAVRLQAAKAFVTRSATAVRKPPE